MTWIHCGGPHYYASADRRRAPNADKAYSIPDVLPEITIKPVKPAPEAKKADPDIVEVDSIPVKAPKAAEDVVVVTNGDTDQQAAKQVAGIKRPQAEADQHTAAEGASKKRKVVQEISLLDDDDD